MTSTLTVLALLVLSLPALTAADGPTITANWSNRTFTSKTTPTLQMVLNPLVSRASPIHDEVYRTLHTIRPSYARYQSWFPYPKMAVPEIDPPSGLSQCRSVAVDFNANLSCELGGGTIDTIEFASFGLPTGTCRSFMANDTCTAPSSMDVINKLCVGQPSCSIPAATSVFGSPCPGHEADYRLAVQVTCNPPQNNTYWDMTYFDPVVVDFLEAVGPYPSLDLSTTPAWMWQQDPSDVHHYPDSAYQVDWGYNTGDRLVDPTCEQVGQYYGRIAAWFTMGGFTDEYGYFHKSPHHYKLSLWEMLNEMEHGLDVELYTCIYDQAVKWVRNWADPQQDIQFVGLAEEDPTRYDDYRCPQQHTRSATNTARHQHSSACYLPWLICCCSTDTFLTHPTIYPAHPSTGSPTTATPSPATVPHHQHTSRFSTTMTNSSKLYERSSLFA